MSSKIRIEVKEADVQYDPNARWSYHIFIENSLVLIRPAGTGQHNGWQKEALDWLHKKSLIDKCSHLGDDPCTLKKHAISVVYK
jgi:hypothetical protein